MMTFCRPGLYKMRRRKPLVFISAVVGLCLFFCFLSLDIFSAQDPISPQIPCEWTGVDRIVVVGDLHGAYESFLKILQGTGVVDSRLHWTGEKTHLVQIGDVMDRGDRARDIIDLLIRLEPEAEAAGGSVHCLIGNHEEMNLSDTAFDHEDYITPAQFVSFVGRSYFKKQEKTFRRQIEKNQSEENEAAADLSIFWQDVIDRARMNSLHRGRRSYFKNLSKTYGDWILSHNVVIKINGIVFVHAGITEPLSTRNLKEMNDRFRLELGDVRRAILTQRMPAIPEYEREMYNNPNGLLWSRDLVQNDEAEYDDDVEQILKNLQADHIVVGHSPLYAQDNIAMERYGGKVWIVDTGISDYYRDRGGFLSALIIENGRFRIWMDESNSRESEISGILDFAEIQHKMFKSVILENGVDSIYE